MTKNKVLSSVIFMFVLVALLLLTGCQPPNPVRAMAAAPEDVAEKASAEFNYEQAAEYVSKMDPQLVGLTSFTFTFYDVWQTAWAIKKQDLRLMDKTLSQAASVTSTESWGMLVPALFTRISMPPSFSLAAA